jgi:hypothetical protein
MHLQAGERSMGAAAAAGYSVAWEAEANAVDSTKPVPTRRAVAHACSETNPAAHDVQTGITTSLPEQSPQQRRTARIAGWLTRYVLGSGDDTRVTLGALLERDSASVR